jgi:hypothetical protein
LPPAPIDDHFRQTCGSSSILMNTPRIAGDRLQLVAQFGDDFLQQFGLKNVGGLAERTQRRAPTTEFTLHLPQLAGLLDGPQGTNHGMEQEPQDEHAVLVEVQRAVAGLVALATHLVQARRQGSELVELLQARHVLFAYVLAFLRPCRILGALLKTA